MYKLYLLPIIALTIGCGTHTGNDTTQQTLEELKAIRQEVAALSDSIAVLKDSVQALQVNPASNKSIPAPEQNKPAPPQPPKENPKPSPLPKPKIAETLTDTIYHKYINGKVSVKITPWENQKRLVLFYDLYGNETFSLEEVRHSYTVSVDLKFAENGSVHTAIISNNPGASMYWYKTEITFTTTNEPVSKIARRYPQNSLEDIMKEKWVYWHKQSKTWREQEVME